MSRHKKINRIKEIDRRRQRKARLARLRERYLAARTDAERQAVFELVARRVPFLTVEEFTSPAGR